MKRILIILLLVVLTTSYIVQKQHVIKNLGTQSLQELMRPVIVEEMEKKDAKQLKQEVELLAYPPPPDEPLFPYPPPDSSPTRIPFPTPTLRPTPTYAPTMNPWDN